MGLKDSEYRPQKELPTFSSMEQTRFKNSAIFLGQYARSKTPEDLVQNICDALETVNPVLLAFMGGRDSYTARLSHSADILSHNAHLLTELDHRHILPTDVLRAAVAAHGFYMTEEQIKSEFLGEEFKKTASVPVFSGESLPVTMDELHHMHKNNIDFRPLGIFGNISYVLQAGSNEDIPITALKILDVIKDGLPSPHNATGVITSTTLQQGSYYNTQTKVMHIQLSKRSTAPREVVVSKCLIDIDHERQHTFQKDAFTLIKELDAYSVTIQDIKTIEKMDPILFRGIIKNISLFLEAIKTSTGVDDELQQKLVFLGKENIREQIKADHNISNNVARNNRRI